MKDEVISLLKDKAENTTAKSILDLIDFFTEGELKDIRDIILVRDAASRKEILTRQLSEYESTIDDIIAIWLKFEKIKTIFMYEWIKKQSKESLLKLRQSMDLKPNM